MDVITERANRFAKYTFEGYIPHHKKTYDEVKLQTDSFDNTLDKIKFLNIIIRSVNEAYQQHQIKCKNPDECGQEFEHANLIFFLSQELNRLGVKLDQDIFSQEEKQTAETKLDQISRDLDYLITGQKIIYEDLMKEINELKDLYFLGKKKWHQLLVGKVVDMAASGVVSETVSKGIIKGITKDWSTIKILIDSL